MADSSRSPFRGAILEDHQADGFQARMGAARARSRGHSGTSLGARFCEVAPIHGREKGMKGRVVFGWLTLIERLFLDQEAGKSVLIPQCVVAGRRYIRAIS